MDVKLRQKAKNNFEKDLFKLINNYLVSELNYHTTKFLPENLLPIEMRKIEY